MYSRHAVWEAHLLCTMFLYVFRCFTAAFVNVFIYESIGCVTIVRNDSPGGEGGVQASKHPEHAEPAEMFSTLIHLQELSEVGVHDRDRSTNPGAGKTISSLHHDINLHVHSEG